MATKIRKEQIEEIIQPQATADWTKDDITASAKAIAAKIASSGVRKITTNYRIFDLEEGLYHVDGTKQADYGGGAFTRYQNYYLFVANYNNVTQNKKRYIAFWELDNNGDDIEIFYGTCSARSGTLASKKLSQIKNMGGASSGAAGSAGFAPAPAAGDNTKYLRGDATWQAIPGMVGATSSVAGSAGLVPAPSAGNEGKFLRGNATWDDIIKIYHWSDTPPYVDASVSDIISDYNNGYSVFLELDGHYRFPLYQVVEGDRHKWVIFGFTALYNSYTKVDCYNFRGEINDGVETWERTEANTDCRFPGGNDFVGATSALPGEKGLVPAPPAGSDMMVLRGDCSWAKITMYLETVAVAYQQSGLYRYFLEYNGQTISYNEINTAYQKGVPIVVKNNNYIDGLWFMDFEHDTSQQRYFITFVKVGVYQNQLQYRRLRYTVENDTEYWDEIIEYTTT